MKQQKNVLEYLQALQASEKFGPQVVAHRAVPASEGHFVQPDMLVEPLQALLQKNGIKGLYSHQAEAIQHILDGKNVIVATATASGKSFIYNLPVLQSVLDDPATKALYLFPLKALAQDQFKTLNALTGELQEHLASLPGKDLAAIYDGDTSAYKRRKIRDQLPPIIISNPDMLHLSMLPYHDRWALLFKHLKFIVIDEVHTYKGVFGSNIAWVLRRLERMCAYYGSHPVFILSSATIGNPVTFAEELTGKKCIPITRSGARQAEKHTMLLNPLDSAAGAATLMLEAAVHRKLRTIIYTQSRKMTELITMWSGKRLKELNKKIASYRAGFLPEDRRMIEQKLFSGELLGVISTSALELGIDIGALDICIMVGYPGSIMAARQRAGRVGRSNRSSLVLLVGHEDALDQFFMRNPDDFFEREVESVTLNPLNPYICGQHLVCAAAEQPLTRQEPLVKNREVQQILHELVAAGELFLSADGDTWFSPRKYPQRHVSIRGSGTPFTITITKTEQKLGEIDGHRVIKECHEGAIYLHMAQTYHVDTLDLENRTVRVSPITPNYYTRVQADKHTEILETFSMTELGAARIGFGRLRVTETITGFSKILTGSMKIIGRYPLDLPPQIFETEGFWVILPPHIQKSCEQQQYHFMGGIHAMEHAIIGMMPLTVLCDRNDIGGISYPWHEQLGHSAVFVYDGYAGGMGLSRKASTSMDELLTTTFQAVRSCSCDRGCPSCVHSPKCGSGNRPIDKAACLFVMEALLKTPQPGTTGDFSFPQKRPQVLTEKKRETATSKCTNYCVFDLETKRSAQEVGGWHRAGQMGLSVGVVYDSNTRKYSYFFEENVDELIAALFTFDLVIGFNNKRFDNKVLSAYTTTSLARLPSLDLLEVIYNQLGYRLSLDHLAEQTLGEVKQGNGLQALEWYKNGETERLKRYCKKDVELTHDLFTFGLRQQYLLFQNKARQTVRLPLDLGLAIQKVLTQEKHLYGQTRFL